MTHTEALKLALEALEKLTGAAEGFSVSGVYFNEELWARKCLDDAYDAMGFAQEALAQPDENKSALSLYESGFIDGREKGLKEAQPEQEPVIGTKTWFEDGKVVTQHLTAKDIYKDPEQPEHEPATKEQIREAMIFNLPLYTTPPQRTWVGLTEDEKLHIEIMGGKADVMLAEMVEAKLKEKNK